MFSIKSNLGKFDLKFLPSLHELSLAHNHLNFIHAHAFDSLTRLNKLELTGNHLMSLPSVSIAYKSLTYLSVSDNVDLV